MILTRPAGAAVAKHMIVDILRRFETARDRDAAGSEGCSGCRNRGLSGLCRAQEPPDLAGRGMRAAVFSRKADRVPDQDRWGRTGIAVYAYHKESLVFALGRNGAF